MILAIDCGNTHTNFGCIKEDGEIAQIFCMESNRKKTGYEYAADIDEICTLLKICAHEFQAMVLSSVVPELTGSFKEAAEILGMKECFIVNSENVSALSFSSASHEEVGPDLIVSAVAAKKLYPLPAIIIDMGTASTLTVVSKEGIFMGGVILPGVGISMNALAKETSLLPSIDVAPAKKLISLNTVDAMRSGIIYGTAGSLDGIINRFLNELGENASLLATGGLSHLICPYCKHEIIVDENLLLKGLWEIWMDYRASLLSHFIKAVQ